MTLITNSGVWSLCARLLLLAALACAAGAQQPGSPAPAAQSPRDSLGRSTPRGTVLGFLSAGRQGDDETAVRYLNTRKRGKAAQELAHQLFTVLDQKLPAKLNQLNDDPAGSLSYPNDPDQELVGKIPTAAGDVDVLLQRIDRGKAGAIWLFSSATLAAIPDIFDALDTVEPSSILPRFLVDIRIGHIALFQWLSALIALPLLYFLAGPLNRIVSSFIGKARRRLRRRPELRDPELLPGSVRLIVLAIVIRWALSALTLSLLGRQFWTIVSNLLLIGGFAWGFIRLNTWGERRIRERLGRRKLAGAVSMLRFGRRATDVLVLLLAMLVALHSLGVNVSTALAGLGVGGIAVALAAQKTLENVIGGMSLVFDQAVRVGDYLKVGDKEGVVEQVGLRSTRILTNDRTIVSIPNGQIATVSLENFSVRDKFWFRHTIGLAYGTTLAQLRDVLGGLVKMLSAHASIEEGSVRVRLLRLGSTSLEIELFAYVLAGDYPQFLKVQEELLLRAMELVQMAGTRIALPSQTVYFEGAAPPLETAAAGVSDRNRALAAADHST